MARLKTIELQNDLFDEGILYNFMNFQLYEKNSDAHM
jgi:hypothetical protein